MRIAGRSPWSSRLGSIAAAAGLTTAGCSGLSAGGSLAPPSRPAAVMPGGMPVSGLGHITHVIVMVQENRSFDDFFATFPGADGATRGLMKTPHGDVYVTLKKKPLESDSLGHEHYSFEKEYDHGKLDGFNNVDRAIAHGVKIPAGTYAYRYVNPVDIPEYYAIAGQYVLGDHMFTTQSSSSFTAHQDLIAGGTPVDGDNVIDFPVPAAWGCTAPKGTVTSLITPTGKYLPAKGPFPCFTYPTLRDLLDAKNISWKYFTNAQHGYVWDAFDAIRAVRFGPEWTTNVVAPQTKIYAAIRNGALPNVSWVIPDAFNSDHPGIHKDTGPSWIASVINAVGESKYWPSSVVIVVWDDWGGQYDHVPPPQLDGQGLGFRVPMLLVSPYARETSAKKSNYISHTQYEFGSILKLIEQNWNLGSLGTSDVRANSLIDCFNFTAQPRAFTAIRTKYSQAYFERRKPSGLAVDDE